MGAHSRRSDTIALMNSADHTIRWQSTSEDGTCDTARKYTGMNPQITYAPNPYASPAREPLWLTTTGEPGALTVFADTNVKVTKA
jgi:hypothetical protein